MVVCLLLSMLRGVLKFYYPKKESKSKGQVEGHLD